MDHIQRKKAEIAKNIAKSYNQPSDNSLEKAEDADFEKKMNEHQESQESLEKGGEGSRGGKIIGHTKSGKAIYDSHNHSSHSKFTSEDHEDATRLHAKLGKNYTMNTEEERKMKNHHKEQAGEHDMSSNAAPGSQQLSQFDKEKKPSAKDLISNDEDVKSVYDDLVVELNEDMSNFDDFDDWLENGKDSPSASVDELQDKLYQTLEKKFGKDADDLIEEIISSAINSAK